MSPSNRWNLFLLELEDTEEERGSNMTIRKSASPTRLAATNTDSTTWQNCKFTMINGILIYNVPSRDDKKTSFQILEEKNDSRFL